MSKRILDFYFDFLSPYSYLSWCKLRGMRDFLNKQDIELRFRPVPLGNVITSYETKGPAEIDSKRNYLFKDCLRKSKLQGIPFKTPASLPFNSLYVLRICLGLDGEKQWDFVDLVFRSGWESGKEIGDDESLKVIFNEAGLNGEELLDLATDREMRKGLKQNLKDALNVGVFGVPSFKIDDELFWGEDSMSFLELYILGDDPLDKSTYVEFEKNYPIQK